MLSTTVPTMEEALTTRLLQSTINALELFGVYLGKELGLYSALGSGRRMTPAELADATGIAPRYAREWLEQQAVAGLLEVDRPSAGAEERQYWLPAEHWSVLVAEDHPSHLAPLAQMVAGIGGALGRVVTAYRTGDGVAYPHFGEAFRKGQAGINRPAFVHDLVERWLPAAADVHHRLRTSNLRVADVGCGAGWSTVALARAFPLADVTGFDADEASIADARRNAAAEGLSVRFEVRDAIALTDRGRFDLVLVLEALHDMSRPVEVLRALRQALAPGGSVIVADEKVAEEFHAPGDENERLMYGWSIVHCLPVSMAESPSAAIGTVIRSDTVRALAAAAGFARVDVVPVDGGFFRIYRLSPDQTGTRADVPATSPRILPGARDERAAPDADVKQTIVNSNPDGPSGKVDQRLRGELAALERFVSLPTGVRLAYVEQGPANGVPLVFLHGVTDSWRSFEPLLRQLPTTVRAFAVSQRGHGNSSRPETGYRYSDMADDLWAFMDAMGLRTAIIAGHSMGAMVAQQFVVDHPDRVRAVVLMGAFSTLYRYATVGDFVASAIEPLTDPIDPAFAREWQLSTLARDIAPRFLDVVVAETLKVPARVWHRAFEGFLNTPDVLRELRSVSAPTLLVWGDRDTYATRADQDALLAAIPRARLLVYEGAGHALHWEDPGRFARDLTAFVIEHGLR